MVFFIANSIWMWNLCVLLRWASFLLQCTICMLLFMGPNEKTSSSTFFAKLEV